MHPDISAHVRDLTYNQLKDADQVLFHPRITGLQSHIVFFDHSVNEEDGKLKQAGDSGLSKVNTYEAALVVKIVKYLLQQGYGEKQLVVLTPYLGQLLKIKQMLEEVKQRVDISSKDVEEIKHAGENSVSASFFQHSVRIATIDNYQGEESDIVIISLVRSNPQRQIGFLCEPERVNVMLSRARHAMILIGDSTTLANAKGQKRDEDPLWNNVIKRFKANKQFFSGLPVYCRTHPDCKQILCTPEEFDEKSPDGDTIQQKICSICTKLQQQQQKNKRKADEQVAAIAKRKAEDEVRHNKAEAKLHLVMQKRQALRNQQDRDVQIKKLKIQHDTVEKTIEIEKNSYQQNVTEKITQIQKETENHIISITKTKVASSLPLTAYSSMKVDTQIENQVEHVGKSINLGKFPNASISHGFQILKVEAENNQQLHEAYRFFSALEDLDAQYMAFHCMALLESDEKLELPLNNSLVGLYVRAMALHKNEDSSAVTLANEFLEHYVASELIPNSWKNDMQQVVTFSFNKCSSSQESFQNKWEKAKSTRYENCKALDQLLPLAGLETVKNTMLSIYHTVNLEKRRNNDPKKIRTHARFEGNPGTGKTTVARIYAKFLVEIGALSGNAFEETSGAKLAGGGINELKNLINKIENSNGGVLFIDEAYQLDTQSSPQGRSVANLLTELEDKIGKITVLFAGYKKDMEKLFEYNEGFKSRFAFTFPFQDYTNDELLQILQRILKTSSNPYKVEGGEDGKFLKIVSNRIGAQRGHGFGNARTVKSYFDVIIRRQSLRLIEESISNAMPSDLYFLTQEDLLGPRLDVALSSCQAWNQLQGMIGLASVKESVKNMIAVLQQNYSLELELKPPQHLALNRVFLGNPGTGKTTVAHLYAQILKDLGFLSKGEVIIKTASEFVGAVVGESEKITNNILKSAEGCVLVIDEAYGLYSKNDVFKTAVINTIVERVQNVPGDDRCVLLLGYKEQMEEMMRDSNPGLMRRFNWDSAFHFEDYSADDLTKILNLKLKEKGILASSDARFVAVEVLEKEKRQKNFGNGGAVENIISRALLRYNARIKDYSVEQRLNEKMLPEDFMPKVDIISPSSYFSDIVGCSAVLNLLESYQKIIQTKKAKGINPFDKLELNFLFIGPSGTGKTTISKKMGMVFKSLGMLATDEICEHSASDLIAEFTGQTAGKTKAVVEAALGKVLIIKEAYRLSPSYGPFATDAINELVQLLTNTKIKNNLVVILAGHEEGMNTLISSNSGLKSRFSRIFKFESFTTQDCWKLLQSRLNAEQMILTNEVCDDLNCLMNEISMKPHFGNGRDIETLANRISNYVNITRNSQTKLTLTKEEVEHELKIFLEDLRTSEKTQPINYSSGFQAQTATQDATRLPTTVHVNTDSAPPTLEEVNNNSSDTQRDPNVPDNVWLELQEAVAKKQKEDKLRDLEIARIEAAKQRASEAIVKAEANCLLLDQNSQEPEANKEKMKKQLEQEIYQEKQKLLKEHENWLALVKKQQEEENLQNRMSKMCPRGSSCLF